MTDDPIEIARASYQAYVDKDRATIEALIADDVVFCSPLDNGIDRASYFERCWPNSETIAGFEYAHLAADGPTVFVTYEGVTTEGRRFRNTEVLTVKDSQIAKVEVYFGWDVPHAAPEGGFLERAE